MKVDVVRAAALGPAELTRWDELQRASLGYRSPFFRPEFATTVAQLRDVRVAVIEDAGTVAGFLPFEVGRRRSGRPAGRPFSDYHGVVLDQGTAIDPRALVRDAGLAAWSFDHVPAEMPAFAPYAIARGASPYLDLSDGFERYLERGRARSDVRNSLRKARKLAREVGSLRLVPESDAPDLLDRMIEWKRRQYAETGVRDVLADAWARDLLRLVHESRAAGFSGMLSALYVGATVAAIHLGLRSGHVLHSWFPAYDPALHRYSPGLVLMLELAAAADGLGITEIDLGKGEARYKQALASGSVPLLEGSVGARALSAVPARLRVSARRALRSAGVHRAARRVIRRAR